MELSLLNAVLDSITRFTSLSSCAAVKSEPIRKYYQNIEEALKLLRRVIDATIELEPVSNEQLSKALVEIDAFVHEAIELVESWHQLSSKICVVFQIESLVTKLKGSGLGFCKIVDPNLKPYLQKIELISSEDLSHVVKEAIANLVENSTPSSDNLAKIVDSLQLTSNQDLLLESVALERVKVKAEHGENNWDPEYVGHMIALIMHMHESLMKAKHSQTVNGVPLPADFCCPLSLELMSDPVIVASGQTYERAFISKWLDQGISVCPKTRQILSHTNLIPNYTVKALIANWCESNNIKLPDPIKSAALNQPSALLANVNGRPGDSHMFSHTSQAHCSRSPEANRSMSLLPSNGIHSRCRSLSPSHLTSSTGAENGLEADIGRMSFQCSEQESRCDEQSNVRVQPSGSSRMEGSEGSLTNELYIHHTRSDSISSAVSSIDANEPSQVSGELTHYISDVSGELVSENSPAPSRESEQPAAIMPEITRPRSHSIWRRPSDRLVPRIVSSTSLEARPDLAGVENQVRKLVEDLQSTSLDVQRDATEKLRLLAKHSMDNRLVIANCGAIMYLVNLLRSLDLKTQEHAVTALLNLSINDNNKTAIANAGAIEPLIHVLEYGNPEARENSAATLFSLSVLEENKVKIGRSNAIRPLVDLLGSGTPRGKKDAATALFNLSIFHENKPRIVQAGAVKHLVELMDPAAGMVDKAVAVLANLATIQEGRTAIGQLGGIPVLVEVVELGSSRGKENAASALLHICRQSNRFCTMVLQEGAVPPLVALSQSGTPRAKEKAQALLNYFRSQRHNNAGRG